MEWGLAHGMRSKIGRGNSVGMLHERWRRRRHDILVMVARRFGFLIPLLVLVTIGVFALAAVSPYDPLDAYMDGRAGELSIAQQAKLVTELRLDTPWYLTWWEWISSLFRGELGISRSYYQPVAQVLRDRLPWTLLLGVTGLMISVVVSLLLGAIAGFRPQSLISRSIGVLTIILQATPPFVLALSALGLFALSLHWAPTGGLTYPGQPIGFASTVRHLLVPGLVLGVTQIPWLVLSLKDSIAEVLTSDAVRGARVRGIPYPMILRRHVLPTALPPFIALVGARLPELVVGSVLVETIFAWPGLGSALVRSAQSLDFPLLTFLTLAITMLVLIGNLLADVIYVVLDPRVDADA